VVGVGSGLKTNQQNVGRAISNFFNSSGGIPMVFGAPSPRGSRPGLRRTPAPSRITFNAVNHALQPMPVGTPRGT